MLTVRVEQARLVTSVRRLPNSGSEFDRLYFGHEFCERLLPTPSSLARVLEWADEHRVPVTLVTPYATEAGLRRITTLLEEGTGKGMDEIVANDLGVVRMVRRCFPSQRLVLGRLLTRQMRDPRIMRVFAASPEMAVIDGRPVFNKALPPERRFLYTDTPLNGRRLQSFLLEAGVRRLEFDNLLHGFEVRFSDGLSGSLYVPWGCLATSRRCWPEPERSPEPFADLVSSCERGCRRAYDLTAPHLEAGIVKKGNTLFVRNNAVPSEQSLGEQGIDRIVRQQDMPH